MVLKKEVAAQAGPGPGVFNIIYWGPRGKNMT